MSAAGGSPGTGRQVPARRRRAHAVELVLDDDGEAAARRRWEDLEAVGVPSLARHRGASHRPHVTVASGPRPSGEVLRAAELLVGPLLPADLTVTGLGLLGPADRTTLVELVAPVEALRAVREELVALWAGADGRPWLAHLTLARRLTPSSVALALDALGAGSRATTPTVRAVALRWWDPDAERAVPLGGG